MNGRKRKNGQGFRTTFREILAGRRDQCNRRLFDRASTASQLAKSTRGTNRRFLYLVKHRCLLQLIERGDVHVGVDHDRYPGLLTVGLHRYGGLHTHEAWLDAARQCRGTLQRQRGDSRGRTFNVQGAG